MPQPPTAVRLALTVPCDPGYRDLLEAVSRKMAAYVGYADADAVAGAVLQATGGLLDRDPPPAYASVELTFAASDRDMEILLRYVRKARQAAPGGDGGMKRALRGAPLEAMRRVMARVELGLQDGVECCRLTRRLPAKQ